VLSLAAGAVAAAGGGAALFVSNALSRPAGLQDTHNGTLCVAETPSNHVTAIPNALTRTTAVNDGGSTLSSGGALTRRSVWPPPPTATSSWPTGTTATSMQVSPQGKQVATKTLVHNGAGDLFGLMVAPAGNELIFVNDGTNALDQAKAG